MLLQKDEGLWMGRKKRKGKKSDWVILGKIEKREMKKEEREIYNKKK